MFAQKMRELTPVNSMTSSFSSSCSMKGLSSQENRENTLETVQESKQTYKLSGGWGGGLRFLETSQSAN